MAKLPLKKFSVRGAYQVIKIQEYEFEPEAVQLKETAR